MLLLGGACACARGGEGGGGLAGKQRKGEGCLLSILACQFLTPKDLHGEMQIDLPIVLLFPVYCKGM